MNVTIKYCQMKYCINGIRYIVNKWITMKTVIYLGNALITVLIKLPCNALTVAMSVVANLNLFIAPTSEFWRRHGNAEHVSLSLFTHLSIQAYNMSTEMDNFTKTWDSPKMEANYSTTYIWVFNPRPVLAYRYCGCLRLSVCPCGRPCINCLLVRMMTCDSFKPE